MRSSVFQLLMKAVQKRDESLNAVNERIASETKRKTLAEFTLSSLGLFKFEEKKETESNY